MMARLLTLLCLLSCNTKESKEVEIISDSIVVAPVISADTLPAADTILFNYKAASLKYKEVVIKLAKGDSFVLKIPAGYNISIAAEGLQRLRFLALSPDKRLFATDMFDRSDNHKGRVLAFDGWNDTIKKFEKITTYLDSLHNPNQAIFYKNYIYVAETDKLSRYIYNIGDTVATDRPEIIADFPAYGLSYKYGGWHLTRSMAFHNDKLYVSVGSSCNACVEKENIRASIVEMNPDGTERKIYARGLRNSVGIKWIGDQLWATGMGRDLIGPDKPEDLFQQIKQGAFYGWPYYFQYRDSILTDPEFKDSTKPSWAIVPPRAFTGFRAHSAPLGFEYFNGFDDDLLDNSVLVCLHGSTSVWRQRGNSVVKIGKGNRYVDIVSGFLSGKTEADRHGRPCDIIMNDKRSFFFSDDHNGVLYYVWK